jgi:hypothetical protein
MPRIKPLRSALELETYADERTVLFKLVGAPTDAAIVTEVHVPLSIAFRLYYLGRAFDGQVVKLIKPNAMVRIDYTQLQLLKDELEFVAETTIDPVSKHYLALLLPMVAASTKYPSCALNVIEQ